MTIAAMPRLTRVVLAAAGLAALAAPATAQLYFTARRPIQAQCTYNHECADGLLCSNGFCRAECATDRDCATGQSCVIATPATIHVDGAGRPGQRGVAEAAPAPGIAPGRCRAAVALPSGPARQSPVPVILPGSAVGGDALVVTAVKLVADSGTGQQKCPANVTFRGFIVASGSGAVTYRLVRSDGGTGAPVTVKFGAAGQQPITANWSLGETGDGALTVEVLFPNAMRSSPATFAVECVK